MGLLNQPYARLEGWRSQTAGGGPERERSPGKRVAQRHVLSN